MHPFPAPPADAPAVESGCACRGPTASLWRRGLEAAGWLLPGAVLALLPKCPLCLAAYLAAWSGLSLSLGAATWLRSGLAFSAVACLAFVTARRIWKKR